MDGALSIRRDEILGREVIGVAVYHGTFNGVEVAVKSTPKFYFNDGKDCETAKRELETVLSLNHENVVKIHHVEENHHFR